VGAYILLSARLSREKPGYDKKKANRTGFSARGGLSAAEVYPEELEGWE
jgi:hypothetical protein